MMEQKRKGWLRCKLPAEGWSREQRSTELGLFYLKGLKLCVCALLSTFVQDFIRFSPNKHLLSTSLLGIMQGAKVGKGVRIVF